MHEYGGGAWAVASDRTLVFAEFTDQRLYRLDEGSSEPTPLTPDGLAFRFGDIAIRDAPGGGVEVIAVREIHDETDPSPSA